MTVPHVRQAKPRGRGRAARPYPYSSDATGGSGTRPYISYGMPTPRPRLIEALGLDEDAHAVEHVGAVALRIPELGRVRLALP